jgi:SAM-dependent methyltransferase
MSDRTKIKQYWDQRARRHLDSPSATTDDVHLRELEISTIFQVIDELSIPSHGNLLDIGCGDGFSTIKLAQLIPTLNFLGVDYSENMILSAYNRLEAHPELTDRVSFVVGDVLELEKICGSKQYEIVLTDRCLINLESIEHQSQSINSIAKHVTQSGYYISIENFIEGHKNLNAARCTMGLPEIPMRWHNLYFNEREFSQIVNRDFEILAFKDFSSSYYFATRVIYSKMCQMRGESPDYNHEIHQLAVDLPWIGQFSPIKMAVLRKRIEQI